MAAVKETCGKDDGMWDFDDELLLMMGEVVQCRRSRQRWLALRIEELEAKVHTPATLRELERHRVEFGMTNEGGKKPKVCWDFVHNGHCGHGVAMAEKGRVRDGRWHPGCKEAAYLKKKTSN